MKLKSTRWFLPVAAAVAVGCGGSGGSGVLPGAPSPRLRVVNAFSDASQVDAFVGSQQVLDDAGFGGGGAYQIVDNGNRAVVFRDSRTQGEVARGESLLENERFYTAVGVGAGATRDVIFVNDDRDNPSGGRTKFTLINAANGLGSVDLYVTPAAQSGSTLVGLTPTVEDIAFKTSTQPLSFDVDTYRIRIAARGSKTVAFQRDIRFNELERRTLVLTRTRTGAINLTVLNDNEE